LVNGECVPVQESTGQTCDDEQANNFEEEEECTYDPVVLAPITGTITYSTSTNTTGTVVATMT